MIVCLVTRQDLYPAVHGAAVKIVRTAEGLSRHCGTSYAVTTDRLAYHRWRVGQHEMVPYPARLVAATRTPDGVDRWCRDHGLPDYWELVQRILNRVGYPREEHLLYQPVVDADFWIRTLYVGLRHGVDVFQAEFPGFAVPCILAAAITRARTAVVEHNAEWQRLADTTEIPPALIARFRRIEAALLRRVDDVIAVSTVDRDQLVDAGVRRERVTVIPHGVDVAGFERAAPNDLRQRLGLPPGVPLLFFHGTLHYEPNTVALRVLVDEILPRLEASGTRVQVVAGGMNPPSDIVHPWLHYTGVIHDLAAAIAAADLCVVPLLAGGGTRLKLLEYLAAGRPTLSTLKGAEGLRVHDGDEMALVADGDWDGFCARIRGLLADPAGAAALGNRGQTFARRYDWSAICGAYVDLYEGRGRGSDLSGGIEPGGATTRAPAARRSRWRLLAEKLGATVGSPCRVPRAARPGESTVAHEPRTRPPAPRRPRRETSNAQRASDRRGARNWRTQAPEPGAPGIDFDAAITSHLPATPRWTKPRAAIVMLNRRCNLRCEFCDHWRHRDDLPRALVDRLIEQAGDVGVRLLVLTGGEPFLRRDLFEIIDAARRRELTVNVTTNGTLLTRRIRLLQAHPPHSLSVSIDGCDATHDRHRGRDGTADRAWAGLERLRSDTDIALNVYFVVTRHNVGELPEVHDRARALGAGFDFWPVNGHPELGLETAAERRSYRDALDHVLAADPDREVHRPYYEYGLEYLAGRRDHVRCLGLAEQFGVDQQGRVVPCCVWGMEEFAVGNLADAPLAELLTSARADHVRRSIVGEGCHDRCFNHSLYEFEQATGLPFVVQASGAVPGATR